MSCPPPTYPFRDWLGNNANILTFSETDRFSGRKGQKKYVNVLWDVHVLSLPDVSAYASVFFSIASLPR